MDERSLQDIMRHLQREDVKERIQRNIHHGRSQITVPIGGAVDLFGFSENQLRKWEEKGLLKPQRTGRQRHYSLSDLDKLAIIRELIDAKYSPGDIPPNIDSIWHSISPLDGRHDQVERGGQIAQVSEREAEFLSINQRVENARAELFWRYYASRALRLSLMLISDELPDTPAGLVLPLQPDANASIDTVKDLPKLGPSLVGWLSKTRSFHTLFTPAPWFEYDIDYRLLPLTVMRDDKPQEQQRDRTLIVLARRDRRSRALSLSSETVETIKCLLAPLYENAQTLQSYFGYGMHDELSPAPNLDSTTTPDAILDGLADMVIHLGSRIDDCTDRRGFCCILLPKDPMLPLQQHTLVVRAQSQHSPHKVGGTTVTPDKSDNSLSLRAYQSGQVIYHPHTDPSIAHHQVEGPVQSALAMPIGGENGPVIAALYVASYKEDAFSEASQRVLRMIGRMIEEAISTYRTRNQVTAKLTNAIDHPRVVDPLFEEFLSESDFVRDVEDLLAALKSQLGEWKEPGQKDKIPLEERKALAREEQSTGEDVSFIAMDIDNQSSLATKYGDQVARNLSRTVGLRIQRQQRLSTNPEYRKVYHIYADRFYLLLKGMTLDEARNKAEQLRVVLKGNYHVEPRLISAERLRLPASELELPDVTVRLCVSSYTYGKLKELLQRWPAKAAIAEVRAEILRRLDEMLNLGQQEGGNVIISWDIDIWDYKRWSPPVAQSG